MFMRRSYKTEKFPMKSIIYLRNLSKTAVKLVKIEDYLILNENSSKNSRTPKIKFHFSWVGGQSPTYIIILIFPIIFHIFNNSQENFWKIPKLQGLANSKICLNPPKTDPQTFGDPSHLKNPACIAEVGFLLSKSLYKIKILNYIAHEFRLSSLLENMISID